MSIASNNAAIIYSPGNWDVNGTRALSTSAGARLRTLLVGTPTALTFDVSAMATEITKVAYQIDGQGWVHTDAAATVAITMPTRTSAWGKHLLEVTVIATSDSFNRWDTSGQSVAVKFTGITGTVTAVAPTPRALSGLIFGDSIVEGINTITSASGNNTSRSDARLGYAFNLADALGAEVGVIGYGTQGILKTGLGSVPAFPDTWDQIVSGIARGFTGLDFVAINQGTNDNGFGYSATDFKAAYTAVLGDILAAVDCPVMVMLPFNGAYGTTVFEDLIADTVSPSRVRFIDTTGWFSSADAGDGTHPYGYADMAQLAARTANAIRDELVTATGSTFVYSGTAWVPATTVTL